MTPKPHSKGHCIQLSRNKNVTPPIQPRLSKPPETLEQLGDSLALLEQLKTGQEEIEGRFPPLYEQFNILRKHEVQVDEKVWFLYKLVLICARI